MLEALLRQAHAHLLLGLPVDRVQLVLHPQLPALHQLLIEAGRVLTTTETEWATSQLSGPDDVTSDFFVSYRQADEVRVEPMLLAIRNAHPTLQLFVDRERLKPGRYWKHDLLRGIFTARHMLCFITDGYPSSPECMDAFHAALLVNRQRRTFLRPLALLHDSDFKNLPGSISRVHCIDARTPPESLDDVIEELLGTPRA
jgi:hypothetical protein